MPPDFSSSEYWSNRFTKETSFEWLSESDVILPLILEVIAEVVKSRSTTRGESSSIGDAGPSTHGPLKVLHLGCGTSNLGSQLQHTLDQEDGPEYPVQVIDADYVASTITTERSVPLIQMNVLDREALHRRTEEQCGDAGWDLILDKSTADAISCGPNVEVSTIKPGLESKEFNDLEVVRPMAAMCSNLACVTRPGSRWMSISYSSSRFEDLDQFTAIPWKVLAKRPLTIQAEPGGKQISDGRGGFRTVFEPETVYWFYVLDRI
jgi:hypothetical protein